MIRKTEKQTRKTSKRKFLTNDVRQNILDDFETKEDRTLMFVEPQRVFDILEGLLSRMSENKQAASIIDSINSELPEPHRYCILQYLVEAIPELSNQSKWKPYLLKLKRAFESLDDEIEVKHGNPPRFNYNFEKVRKHSKSLPDDISRISYLTEVKTLYEQQDNGLLIDWGQPTFSNQCELEIKKIRDLMKLSETSIPNSKKQSSEKRAFGGTQQQNLLAMYFLLEFIQGKGTVVDKANLISFLTGFSSEKVRQLLPKVLDRAESNWTEFEKDVDLVRFHFQKLGLGEIVKMIENQVTDLERDL